MQEEQQGLRRARESKIQVKQMTSTMTKEKEEDPELFLDLRKHEMERKNLLFQKSNDNDAPLGLESSTSPIFSIASSVLAQKTGTDDFLNSENGKNDYDWLLTPPGSPLFPSAEIELQKTVASQIGSPKAHPTAIKSRLANPQPVPVARSNIASRHSAASSPGSNASGSPRSRHAEPTGRRTLTSASKPTITMAASKPTSTTKSSRSSTPTSTKHTVPPRSSTPLSRTTTTRSSTPATRSTLPSSKPPSRELAPTRRPQPTPSTMTNINSSSPSGRSPPFSFVTKLTGPMTGKKPVLPQRASSLAVKSRPWKSSEFPGYSSLPHGPLTTTRGRRPGAPFARSSSMEHVSKDRVQQQLCSPSRGRLPNRANSSGSSVPAVGCVDAKANLNVSPGLIGTKMVERVIGIRKLMPPKQDDKHSPRSNSSGMSPSSDSSWFGITPSKKSLDMAIRHMDSRRRMIPGNLRPLMTTMPASSMHSVRSEPVGSRTVSVSDSPLATSSNASSEVSVNNNGLGILYGNEVEDDDDSVKGAQSTANVRGR